MAENSVSKTHGNLMVNVGVDCSEAITGFKALQREIKETVKSVKELESSFASLSFDGIKIFDVNAIHKGGKVDTKEPFVYKGIQHAKYLIIDLGDSYTDNLELELKSNEKFSRMWFQDSI